jgi:hypothetical protein
MANQKFKIAYIDDDAGNVRTFQRFASDYFDVVKITLKKDINTVVSDIFKEKVNAVVIDYDLRDQNSRINYQGSDIFEKINARLNDFPAFILTSHVGDAEEKTLDVNAIYDRDLIDDNQENILLKRIQRQITNYLNKIDESDSELKKLRKIKKLSLAQEEKIIELDSYLERSLSKGSQLPNSLKKTTDIKKLSQLISETEKLISEIKKDEKRKKSS